MFSVVDLSLSLSLSFPLFFSILQHCLFSIIPASAWTLTAKGTTCCPVCSSWSPRNTFEQARHFPVTFGQLYRHTDTWPVLQSHPLSPPRGVVISRHYHNGHLHRAEVYLIIQSICKTRMQGGGALRDPLTNTV